MDSDFGKFFVALRKRSGLSQRKLADQAGISLRTLAYWESGQFEPREPELLKALKTLGASESDRKEAFARMTAPRGLRFVREDTSTTKRANRESRSIPGFGNLLIAMRNRNNFSQNRAAQSLGINLSTIVRWERMRWIPSPESIDQLCDALGAFPEERKALANWRTV